MAIITEENGTGNEPTGYQKPDKSRKRSDRNRAERGARSRDNVNSSRASAAIGSLRPTARNINDNGGVMAVLREEIVKFNETLENQQSPWEAQLIEVNNGVDQVYYSAGVLAVVGNINNRNVAYYYTFVLQGSRNTDASPVKENLGDITIEVLRLPSDFMQTKARDRVAAIVANRLHTVEEDEIHDAGNCVVPRFIDVDDEDKIRDLVPNAQEAIWSRVEQRYTDLMEPFSINEFIDADQEVEVVFDYPTRFADTTVTDAVTSPVRCDWSADISVVTIQDARRDRDRDDIDDWATNEDSRLMTVGGYVSIAYDPADVSERDIRNGDVDEDEIKPNIAKVIINNVQATGPDPLTAETFMLGLATALVQEEDYQWTSAFRAYRENTINPIGTLGIRSRTMDDPGDIDHLEPSFTIESLNKLLIGEVSEYPTFMVRCVDSGPLAWLTDMFIGACSSDKKERQLWERTICDVMNRLTENEFEKYWQEGDTICTLVNPVLIGTHEYQGADGTIELRSIEDVDQMAVLDRFYRDDLDIVDDWDIINEPIDNGDVDEVLHKRRRILESILHKVTITARAWDVALEDAFIDALIDACKDANLIMNPQGLHTPRRQSRRRNGSMRRGARERSASDTFTNDRRGRRGRGRDNRGRRTRTHY